jgi:hypothetical protein
MKDPNDLIGSQTRDSRLVALCLNQLRRRVHFVLVIDRLQNLHFVMRDARIKELTGVCTACSALPEAQTEFVQI